MPPPVLVLDAPFNRMEVTGWARGSSPTLAYIGARRRVRPSSRLTSAIQQVFTEEGLTPNS